MSTLTFQSIANTSNLSAPEKSALMKAYENITGRAAPANLAHRVKAHGWAGLNAVRQGGESAVTGALLGLAHTELKGGLDYNVKGHIVPLDGVLAAAAMAASVMFATEDGAVDARNIGASAVSILSFRKTVEFRQKAKGGKVAGEIEDYDPSMGHEDPIIAAARAL